jgi:gliding motility-associated-like protein
MQQTLRNVILALICVVFTAGRLFANPPANDTLNDATWLGYLPAPGPCPSNPYGDTLDIYGSTTWASYNTLDFSPAHCFISGSPDVWYHFRATGDYLYFELDGSNGLDTFFIKLHFSQGSTLSLIPLQCATTDNGSIVGSVPTPTINGDYYLQIGGHEWYETGDFHLVVKSFNDCNSCIKRATVNFSPAPSYGRYNLGDTVTMCVNVDRWEPLSTSYLHSIVPVFGYGWDTLSLTPTVTPVAASSSSGWYWMNAVATPSGTHAGFFFDSDGNGDPSDNAGDDGAVLTNWNACWTIVANPVCSFYDLGVDIHLYSDAETGTTNGSFVCNADDWLHTTAGLWCCPSISTSVTYPTSCAGTAVINISPEPNAASDPYTYTLMDTAMNALQSSSVVIGSTSFTGIQPGEYIIKAENQNSAGCFSFEVVTVHATITTSVTQTVIGCGSGTGEALAEVISGGTSPFTYNWLNVSSSLQNDSVAFSLPDGWIYVTITDATGCSATDSVFITSQTPPDPSFGYSSNTYCATVDSIPVDIPPATAGGAFQLLAPLSVGIIVDPNTGTVDISASTQATPYPIYIAYVVGPANCSAYAIDSAVIIAPPNAPTATTATTWTYCIGGSVPVFGASTLPANYILWYDNQTANTAIGGTFTPPLNASTIPGTYFYGAAAVNPVGCVGTPLIYVVTAVYSPVITLSADTTICAGDTAVVSAYGCATCSWLWSPAPTIGSATTQVISTSPSTTTGYQVTAVDQGGCMGVSGMTVTVDDSCGVTVPPPVDTTVTIHAYGGVSANGDGYNDYWIIDGVENMSNVHVIIFNRWGNKVWEARDYNNLDISWKGMDENGNVLPDGTYYYILTSDNFEGTHGWIELSH